MEVACLKPSRWISISVAVGAGLVLFALLVSAVFEPRIRLLHLLQGLIYVAVIVLARRNSAWGFGAGCFIGIFWNWMFLRNAAGPVIALLTGRQFRPDIAIQFAAVLAHVLLIVACIAGFARLNGGKRWLLEFVGGGTISITYFVLIIRTAGQLYVPLLRQAFGL